MFFFLQKANEETSNNRRKIPRARQGKSPRALEAEVGFDERIIRALLSQRARKKPSRTKLKKRIKPPSP